MTRSRPEPVRLLAAADPVAAFGALPDDATIRLPTSGSTGTSREIIRTVGSWRSAFAAVSDLSGLTGESRLWLPGPLRATMNLYAAVHAAWAGAIRVEALEHATHVHLTPAVLHRLLTPGVSAHEPLDLTGRTLVVAGDGLSTSLRTSAERAGARVAHYYGAAELSFVAWGRDQADLRPFPGVEVDVRDGEIWVRSPGHALGYAGTSGPLRTDDRGFATVGDRGRLEADGRLVVHGRPGAVTTGGATVAVADVEAALARAARGQVAVLGLPHPELGQVLAVVLTDPADRARLSRLALGVARPRRWYVRAALPLTSAGKLDRRALVEDLIGTTP